MEAANANLAGGIRFNGVNGSDAIEILSPNGVFRIGKLENGESINYEGGAGNDTLSFLNASLITRGGIFFEAHDGNNTFDLRPSGGTATIGKLPNGASLLISGGVGQDRVTLNYAELTLLGGLDATLRGGVNVVLMRDYSLVRFGALPNGQSVNYSGGAGENYLEFGGANAILKGSIEFETFGTLASVTVVGNTRVGPGLEGIALQYKGSSGEDRMVFDGSVQLRGGLLFEGAAGTDRLEAEDLDYFSALGVVTFDGGSDNDAFDLTAETIRFANALTFTGGAGADTFALTANGTIAGAVNVDLGDATSGNQAALFTSRHHRQHGLVLNSTLDVMTAGAAGTTDALTVTNLRVGGAVQVAYGDAASAITINNLVAGNILHLATAGGADQVFIETQDLSGNSVIKGLATVLLGDGNDNLYIGSPGPGTNGGLADSTRVRFFAGLTLDAGAGSDTRNNLVPQNDFLGGDPVGLNTFEVLLPDFPIFPI